jgi:uncharacterized protein
VKYLLDVNVLVALHDPAHPHHARASAWFISLTPAVALLTSPITELGFVRVLMQRNKPAPVSVVTAQALLSRFRSTVRVSFVSDDVDASALPAYITKHAETTDGHLLALARRHGAQLITFDVGIPGAHLVP